MSLESKDATCVGSLCERANSHGTRDFAGDADLQAPFRNAYLNGGILKGQINALHVLWILKNTSTVTEGLVFAAQGVCKEDLAA